MVGWVDPIEGIRTMIAHLGHDPNERDGRRRVSDPAHDAPIALGAEHLARPEADPIEAVETQLLLARALLASGRSRSALPVAEAAVAATAMLARDERRRVAAETLLGEIERFLVDGGLTAASVTPE